MENCPGSDRDVFFRPAQQGSQPVCGYSYLRAFPWPCLSSACPQQAAPARPPCPPPGRQRSHPQSLLGSLIHAASSPASQSVGRRPGRKLEVSLSGEARGSDLLERAVCRLCPLSSVLLGSCSWFYGRNPVSPQAPELLHQGFRYGRDGLIGLCTSYGAPRQTQPCGAGLGSIALGFCQLTP